MKRERERLSHYVPFGKYKVYLDIKRNEDIKKKGKNVLFWDKNVYCGLDQMNASGVKNLLIKRVYLLYFCFEWLGASKSEDEVKSGKYVKLNEIIFYFIKTFLPSDSFIGLDRFIAVLDTYSLYWR